MAQNNADALIRYIMEMQRKQGGYAKEAVRAAAGRAGKVRMTETRIYVGLNDSKTREQKFSTDKYLDILKKICRSYKTPFSVGIEEGGYFHEDGEYTEETSLVLTLIDADRDTAQEIAKDLCAFFHQESVLITENLVDGCFISVKEL